VVERTAERPKIGIIGGMGPAATVDLVQKIIRATPAKRDEEHLNIQVDCDPARGDWPESLIARAVRLEQCDVKLLALACNQARVCYDAIQAAVGVPVVHMIREAARAVANLDEGVTAAGVMAWHQTIASGIYQKALVDEGITPLVPTAEELGLIRDLIVSIKAASVQSATRRRAVAVGSALVARGAEALVLGCTELPLALTQADYQVPVIDATRALAEALVRIALS